MNIFDSRCKKNLSQIRMLLKDIDQKLSHLIEQNREERLRYYRTGDNFREK